jgi:hypothetical protein
VREHDPRRAARAAVGKPATGAAIGGAAGATGGYLYERQRQNRDRY